MSILMEWYGVTGEQAFQVVRRYSRDWRLWSS
ncbi:ANTAR domain-containing protein [Kribbella sp.]|nr:ANTAR domain-containing protein [Kribbella sp.]HZX02830.1 ANTAR domain-containing protein [Kribbella sp.]